MIFLYLDQEPNIVESSFWRQDVSIAKTKNYLNFGLFSFRIFRSNMQKIKKKIESLSGHLLNGCS